VSIPTVQVGELALNQSGAFKIGPFGSSLKKTELVESGIPVAGIENVLPNKFVKGFRRFITARKFEELSDYEILPNDVLVTTMGTIGRAASAPRDIGRVIFDSHLFRMRVDTSRVFPPYLCYALNSDLVAAQLARMARGAIMDGLNTKILRECSIPLPEISEQKRIAERLDEADRLRQTRRYALELTDTFLPAAFRELFGSPREVFKRWPVVRLADCCQRITDGTHLTPEFLDQGVPFIFVKNIENARIDFQTDKFISNEVHEKLYSRCPVEEDDILYTIVGATYGQAAPVGAFTKFAFQRHIAHLKPNPAQVLPKFLVTIMQLPIVKTQADRWARGAAQPTINLKELKEFLIPVPPLPLQKRFTAMVERVGRLRAVQREALRQADHLFASLLQRAFSS
jgi:type I restriction enzyme S subunit